MTRIIDPNTTRPAEEQDVDIHPASAIHWMPLLTQHDVTTPKTRFVTVDTGGTGFPEWDTDVVHDAIQEIGGYPAFVRSDQTSAQEMIDTAGCITEYDGIDFTLLRLLDYVIQYKYPLGCLMVREWVDLDHRLTYKDHGYAPEARIFAHSEDGVLCSHFYWPDEAINPVTRTPETTDDDEDTITLHRDYEVTEEDLFENFSVDNEDELQSVLDEMIQDYRDADPQLRETAEQVMESFEGFWSVDFALAESGEWHLIDMAPAYTKNPNKYPGCWHPDSCPHSTPPENTDFVE